MNFKGNTDLRLVFPNFPTMRKSSRYVLYLVLGFIIYQIIDSGDTGLTHKDVRNVLIVAIVVVFILLLIIRMIKNRYDEGGD